MRMRLPIILGAIAAAACASVELAARPDQDGGTDAGEPPDAHWGGPHCPDRHSVTTIFTLSPEAACAKLRTEPDLDISDAGVSYSFWARGPGTPGKDVCTFDRAYAQAVFEHVSRVRDAGAETDDGSSLDAAADGPPDASHQITCPSYSAEVVLTCVHPPPLCGRPFDGYQPFPLGTTPKEFIVACMHMEAASVTAFHLLEEDLRSLGAPKRLLIACHEAAEDEARHTEQMGTLAGSSTSFPVVTHRVRTILEIALENVRVGMVRETYGAVVARVQASRAALPEVRETLLAISEDEMRHAQLSWEVGDFLASLLGPHERTRLQEAMHEEIRILEQELVEEPPLALVSECGLPDAALAASIMSALYTHEWQDASRSLSAPV